MLLFNRNLSIDLSGCLFSAELSKDFLFYLRTVIPAVIKRGQSALMSDQGFQHVLIP